MNLTTVASRAAAAVVAGVAGFASYRHIYAVAVSAGEPPAVAAVLPLAIDGLILVATLAMHDDQRHGRHPRMSARVALAFGVAATLAANVASAAATVTARLVAAVPAVSFLLAVEVLARRGRPRGGASREPATAEPRRREPVTAEPAVSREPAVNREPKVSREPATAEPAVSREPATAEPAVSREPAQRATPRSLTSADRVMAAHLAEPGATHARIAELAGVSISTAKRYRPRASGSPTGPQAAKTPINGRPALAKVASGGVVTIDAGH